MDKDHANTIAISKILDKLNIRPETIGKTKALYKSPFYTGAEPSFWVYQDNKWYDYGVSVGGTLTDFVQRYLKSTGESYTLVDALRWIANMSDDTYSFPQVPYDAHEQDEKNDPVLTIRSVDEIQFIALIRYLEGRGIPLLLAQRYMKQVKVFNKNTGKTFLALGVKNENGGYELRNPFFNGCIRPRTITFIRGTQPGSPRIHIFKDVFDYISILTELEQRVWEHDTILLNALSCVQLAAPYILNYGYKTMYTWMDNNPVGQRATSILNSFTRNQPNLVHLKMNQVYADYLSVNEWHIASQTDRKRLKL